MPNKTKSQLPPDTYLNNKSITILIADDNYGTQKLTATILKKSGYTITTAMNGIEVLSILSQKKIDIIIMDCNMPQMNGLETTSKIRSELSYRDIVIIGTTSAIRNVGKESMCEAGMDDFLPKPISKDTLIACIEQWHDRVHS